MKNMTTAHLKNGYVAITSVIILLFIIISLAVFSSLSSVSESQIAVNEKLSMQALNNVESCADDALLQLNQNGTLPATVNINSYSCSVILEDQSGSDYTFRVVYISGNFTKTLRIVASRTDKVYILSWEEI